MPGYTKTITAKELAAVEKRSSRLWGLKQLQKNLRMCLTDKNWLANNYHKIQVLQPISAISHGGIPDFSKATKNVIYLDKNNCYWKNHEGKIAWLKLPENITQKIEDSQKSTFEESIKAPEIWSQVLMFMYAGGHALAPYDLERLNVSSVKPTNIEENGRYTSSRSKSPTHHEWGGIQSDRVRGGLIIKKPDQEVYTSFASQIPEAFETQQFEKNCQSLLTFKDDESQTYSELFSIYSNLFDKIANPVKFDRLEIAAQNNIMICSQILKKELGLSTEQALAILLVTAQDVHSASTSIFNHTVSSFIDKCVTISKEGNTIVIVSHTSGPVFEDPEDEEQPLKALPGVSTELTFTLNLIEKEVKSNGNVSNTQTKIDSHLQIGDLNITADSPEALSKAEKLFEGSLTNVSDPDFSPVRTARQSSNSFAKRLQQASMDRSIKDTVIPLDSDGNKNPSEQTNTTTPTPKADQKISPSFTLQFFEQIGQKEFAESRPTLATGLLVVGTIATVGVVALAAKLIATFGFSARSQTPRAKPKHQLKLTYKRQPKAVEHPYKEEISPKEEDSKNLFKKRGRTSALIGTSSTFYHRGQPPASFKNPDTHTQTQPISAVVA